MPTAGSCKGSGRKRSPSDTKRTTTKKSKPGSRPCAGLLACQECGNPFVPMIRYWRGNRRVEYVCRGYQRNGKSYCGSHRIHEETLDAIVWEYLTAVRDRCVKEQEQVVKLQKMWALRKPVLDTHILALQGEVQGLEQEIDQITMEQIKIGRHGSLGQRNSSSV